MEKFIKDLISDISDILKIPVLKVEMVDGATMKAMTDSDTCLAAVSSDYKERIIYIRKGITSRQKNDLIFIISHELRHVWQRKYYRAYFLSNYKPRNLCADITEYNMQIAELDANAFAQVYMVKKFHAMPLFNGLPEEVKEEISKYIVSTFR